MVELINVQAYQRVIKRKRYHRTCNCKNAGPKIQLAPNVAKLLPKSTVGISVWAYIISAKYEYHLPLNRVLDQLKSSQLLLPAGTITDGLHKLLPFFIPIYDAIVNRSLEAKHWHADETGWKVFEPIENKVSNRWYMWIFKNVETVVYKIAPSRSSQVLVEHFGEEHPGGTLNVDRYAAYKAIAKKGLFILAYCWAHVRRDFLSYAKGYPNKEEWALDWVDEIAKLYHINNKRIEFGIKSKQFKQHNAELKKQIQHMKNKLNKQRKVARRLMISINFYLGI